jgi:hypothetical protein
VTSPVVEPVVTVRCAVVGLSTVRAPADQDTSAVGAPLAVIVGGVTSQVVPEPMNVTTVVLDGSTFCGIVARLVAGRDAVNVAVAPVVASVIVSVPAAVPTARLSVACVSSTLTTLEMLEPVPPETLNRVAIVSCEKTAFVSVRVIGTVVPVRPAVVLRLMIGVAT